MSALAVASPADEYVGAMRAAVLGVSIVTTDGAGGRVGLTVSGVSSVSAHPPRLLVCVRRRSPLEAAIQASGVFAVNVLGADQAGVAETFAGRTAFPFDSGCARWWAGAAGPLLDGAAAWFDCHVDSTASAGSHTIVLGDVFAASRGGAAPLAYHDGEYATIR